MNTLNRRELLKRLSLTMGGIASASTIAAIVSSCSEAPETTVGITETSWSPKYFGKHQALAIELLSEIIIPRTETPGAIDAGVPAFIESVVKDIFTPGEQAKMEDGLFSLDLISTALFENNFSDSPPEKRYKFVKKLNLAVSTYGQQNLAEKNRKFAEKVAALKNVQENTLDNAKRYFEAIKELTLLGFFTSEIGATQVLKYNPVPGKFEGCVPYEDIGRAWAT